MTEPTYRLPETVVADTKAFRGEVEKFLSGETSPVAFRGIRVPMGIYEQRQNDTYMVRVRGAAGVFLPHQVKLIADLSRTYGNGIVHVTTRQDLQIHDLKIEDTPTILEELLQAKLSSRGGGGNTVRNVSACPFAGICNDGTFDVAPYAVALTEYLTRDRANFNLPRKFKVAFSGCANDCGRASVADLGYFAHEREGVRGFAVYAGGGMGARSALGVQIEEFIPEDGIFAVAEAVKRLFDKLGDRANRNKARLRFVVERLGADGFRAAYREELDAVRREELLTPAVRLEEPQEGSLMSPPKQRRTGPAFRKWVQRNTIAQRQKGLYTILVRLPLGDISAQELRTLANVALTSGDATIRTIQEQDIQLRGITEVRLYSAYLSLRRVDQRFFSPQPVRCVACAGASTCKLGLCLSRGLAEAIEAEVRDIDLPFDAMLRISGCPNSCGHHPISAVGLSGAVARVNGRLVPFYNVLAGGRLSEGSAALARQVGKVPAKAVPNLLREFWTAATANLREGESLDDLMSRWGTEHLRELAKQCEHVPAYEESLEFYRDFGCCTDFSLAGRGPGECGAGVTDAIALDIDEARRAIKQSRLYDAVLAASRALLITRGLDPGKEREVFAAFSEHLIALGWVTGSTRHLLDAALDVKLGDRDNLDDLRDQVEALVRRVEELFLSLDSNLNFRVKPAEEPASDETTQAPGLSAEIDLRGVTCPMNFVRAKIRLEEVEVGQVLEILLDDGEPVRNVPASFAEQGQEVISVVDENTHHRVSIRRKA